jgi:antitoxin (DNA-binding transcriptional repressor) of toxin-antitoxin stability system
MFQTIQISSCVTARGEVVEALKTGEVVVRDGGATYRGRPIGRLTPIGHRNRAEASRFPRTSAVVAR